MLPTQIKDEKLIGMHVVEEIIKSVLFTAFVEHAIPLSILIVAGSGAGKSKTINQFKGDGIHIQNDLTTFDLIGLFTKDKDDQIHHIIVPDLNLPLSHKSSVSKLMIATLLGSTSERIKMFTTVKGGERVEHAHRAIGLISAITPTVFDKNVRKFSELGFVRRMPPIFFQPGEKTINTVLKFIERDKISLLQLPDANVQKEPNKQIGILIPCRFNKDIRNLGLLFAAHLNAIIQRPSWHKDKMIKSTEIALTPISPNLYLRNLVRGHALLCGRKEVRPTDIHFLGEFVAFTDSACPRSI
jgi:hypothetical protein